MDNIISNDDGVVLFGELAENVIEGLFKDDDPEMSEFLEEFEFVGNTFLSDPKEEFFDQVYLMSVIKRKSDDKLFGFEYSISVPEDNSDESPYVYSSDEMEDAPEVEDDGYVFMPVEPFNFPGYKFSD